MFSNFSNVKKKTLAQILSFLVVILIYPRLVAAGFLEFSKPIINVKVGEQFTIDVNIDAESDQVLSTDVRVIYDPDRLQLYDLSADTVNNIIRANNFSLPLGTIDVSNFEYSFLYIYNKRLFCGFLKLTKREFMSNLGCKI